MALVASPALAESPAAPGGEGLVLSVEREAQGGSAAVDQRLQVTAPDPQILVANPGTPTTARDPVNVTGVGQMIIDSGGGSVGLCTGTLINPRTVIFAAHCVNGAAAGTYGANSGGRAIGWGFETNVRANAAGQTDELITWLFGGAGGVGKYKTNVAQAFYNSNYVSYNQLSLDPEARQFLYGDVAMSALDTPAANVPTWALLFSQLPATPITANGTGYHVSIAGYGGNGTGTSGSLAIDFRRRVAENTLGALASLDEFENFLFGTNSTALPQNLYWIDFDDPLRGSAQASVYDFNAWRDNALPNEGITAGGDSGGPLILDRAFAKSLVIGVLSGGYTRFFTGQPANSYGTASFYQPLYLYWDWIAANNFYHYVGSVAGNANWGDPGHWVTNLDPAYQVIVNGQLVNGVPTAPGAGNTDQPGFGQACYQTASSSECLDIASGTVRTGTNPIGTAGNGMAYANLRGDELVAQGAVSQAALAPSEPVAMATATLPAATLDNGLPGATGFVPNNYDGDRVNRVKPRYFDVTLGAAGTTTLNRPLHPVARRRHARHSGGRFADQPDEHHSGHRDDAGQRRADLGGRLFHANRRAQRHWGDHHAVLHQHGGHDLSGGKRHGGQHRHPDLPRQHGLRLWHDLYGRSRRGHPVRPDRGTDRRGNGQRPSQPGRQAGAVLHVRRAPG